MHTPIVIAGAGQAGLQAAESLRAGAFAGPILMIGEEPHPPYQRPPLSKQFLLGEMAEHQLFMRLPEVFARNAIDLVTGAAVIAIDRGAKKVTLSDGRSLDYAGLVLATGARARALPIPGADLDGIAVLRTLDDTKRIAEGLEAASQVAVIGGGFIGLEIAAAARKRGKSVTVFEAADRLMARSLSPLISEVFAGLHEAHGVRLLLNAKVASITGKGGRAVAVVTTDGTAHAADFVVVGVGIVANDEVARGAGLACDNGIIVDNCSRTADPAITAAGDCTARRVGDGLPLLRLESVQNAIEQGKSAAAALLGQERPFTAAPWFWSDQFDVKLQMAGLSAGHDEIAIRGSMPERRFSAFYYRQGKLIAADSLNRAGDHMAARKLLDAGKSPTPAQIADEGVSLARL